MTLRLRGPVWEVLFLDERESNRDWGIITNEDGSRLYEGFLDGHVPMGAGTIFYPNGLICQEGIFGSKGLLCGREYYLDGKLRFEGIYVCNKGYGPNFPICGRVYDADGAMIYEGKLVVSRSGLGYPFVEEPKEFGPIPQEGRPRLP